MWKSYFGPQARIVGVDINPRCANLGEPQIEIVIGDQEDRQFLKSLANRVGDIDVLIEDGGHTMAQQIATFEELWPNIVDGGVFLIEDLHTSYWPKYGGGLRREGTFIEYAKKLVDQQHAWHSRDKDEFYVDDYTRSIAGMHVYDSIIVFDKATVTRPRVKRTGTRSTDRQRPHMPQSARIVQRDRSRSRRLSLSPMPARFLTGKQVAEELNISIAPRRRAISPRRRAQPRDRRSRHDRIGRDALEAYMERTYAETER